ncbi:MAG: hypothetical protein ABR612_13485 [Chromatocurvus sp.]
MHPSSASLSVGRRSLLRLSRLAASILGASIALQVPAAALRSSSSLQTETVLAVATRGGVSQARVSLLPETQLRMGRTWSAEGRLRLEGAASDTGLGTRETYSTVSEPWQPGSDVRIEIDTATLSWRERTTQFTLGKQTVAWGVLDGVQVTDRFDAVRRREAVFTQERPERLSRWGARARFRLGGTRLDAAAAFDGSVNQLARAGDAFDIRAARSRGGLPAGIVPTRIDVDVPDDATFGLRASRTIGTSDSSVMVIHGPDTEPVFLANGTGVELSYPTRTLLGATWQRAAGARVWRLEGAFVPRQPVNLAPAQGLVTAKEARWLIGSGLDWSLPGGIFLNAQLAVDHIDTGNAEIARPETDVVSTLRIQRSYSNERWRAVLEMINVLSDGSGTLRPSLTWQQGDSLALDLGADLIWGQERDLIGQFEQASRVYLRIRKTF